MICPLGSATFAQSSSDKTERNTINVENPWSNGEHANAAIKVPKFFGYPVTERKPVLLSAGDPESERILYELRIQHWFYLFNHEKYEQHYGVFPQLPAGITAEEYRANPPSVPSEYEEMMFGMKKD
ncbi:MAG TPA: hypothetical protein EYN64_03920 [Flavobacteriales bacterium]|nr:hypothetical protein [Flavobacteriales bacterium]